jgi:hypothetical protein
MENQEKKTVQGENDIDLGVVLYKLGKAISAFFAFIGYCLVLIGNGILQFLFFLRRNLLWLLLGLVAGLAFGIYIHSKQGPKYFSIMTVRMNFNSARSLYNTLDYIKALRNENKIETLSKIFGISTTEAKSIKGVQAAPVQTQLILAELYNEQFLRYDRTDRIRLDTFWSKAIRYKDFKASLTKYDYPLHEITVISTDAEIFSKLQKGLIDLISKNELLQRNQKIYQENTQEEENILRSSLKSLDTLRMTYNQKLLAKGGQNDGSNNLVLLDKGMDIRNPELEIYDKVLEFNDELKSNRNRAMQNYEIVQVYSPFSPVGQKVSAFRQAIFSFALNGLILTFLILIIVHIYRYLGKLERRRLKKEYPS